MSVRSSALQSIESLEPRTLLAGTVSEQITVDQFGWRADANVKKVVVFADPINGQNSAVSYTPGAQFQLRRVSDDAVVFIGNVASWKAGMTDSVSGDKAWWGDFTSFTTPGEYYVYDPTNDLRSFAFKLDNALYNDVLETSVRVFYYQRAGAAIDAAHGGNWTHAAGHVGPNQDHAARLWTGSNQGQPRDVWGGWYDAGDYNKYVVYTTGVMWDLLNSYEWSPSSFTDDWNIPESGNGAPDLLDEIKWETDWLLRMQNANGSVLNRVASATYATGNFDPSTDTQPRYYTQATTWATASFAATLAHAARVFQQFNAVYPGYANTLTIAAQSAWNYLAATPNMTPANGLDGGGSGGSNGVSGGLAATEGGSDANADHRIRVLAAAELYKTTGSATYKTYFESNYKNANTSDNGFQPLTDTTPRFDAAVAMDLNHAYVTYATTTGANAAIVNEIKNALRNSITTSWLAVGEYNNQTDPYRSFMWSGHYTWGSNLLKSQWANVLMFAVRLGVGTQAERDKAKEVAEEYLHYINGRNPLSELYLSNMGTKGANLGGDKFPMQVYHSWFGDGSPLYDGASSTYGPPPGYVVGGANQYFSVSTISPPAGQPPMKAFKDWNTGWPENSWEITEPAIYYQAGYTLLLSQFTSVPSARVSSGVLTINGTFNADNIAIGGDATNLTVNAAGQALNFPRASVTSTQVNGLDGNDTLDVNTNLGVPLRFNGGTGDDRINVNAGSVAFDTDSSIATSKLTISVASGASAQFNAPQHLSSLIVSGSAVVAPNASSGIGIAMKSLSITGAGTLDLTNNDMLVDYSAGSSPLASIQGWINSARDAGAWTGAGLTSSTARDNAAHNTTLGAIERADYSGATFDSETLDSDVVLVKYTYYGDANFSGTVTFDDYVRIDTGFNTGRTGWSNGDFNGDGVVNFDDYVLIDVSFNSQGAPLARTGRAVAGRGSSLPPRLR